MRERSPTREHNSDQHGIKCTICAHQKREEIEQVFLNWGSPSRIAREYSVTRQALYRHAWALDLVDRRRRNIRSALERIIEKADSVKVSANAVVAAVSALARINALGQWVERRETIDLTALFDRMTTGELEAYARDGVLPSWFEATVGQNPIVTPSDTQGGPRWTISH